MSKMINFNGTDVELTDTGFLANAEDWSEDLARFMAGSESLELTSEHIDVINYLRSEYFDNNGNQPNTRSIVKAMSDKWGRSMNAKELYALFPGDPSKQAGRLAGLPESRRKGGY